MAAPVPSTGPDATPAPPYERSTANDVHNHPPAQAPPIQPSYQEHYNKHAQAPIPLQPRVGAGEPYLVPLRRLNDQPEEVLCPFCARVALTRMVKSDSNTTMGVGVLLCLFCVCLACLPCMLGWAQNIEHFCGACGKALVQRHHDSVTQLTPAAEEALRRLEQQQQQQQMGQPQQYQTQPYQTQPQPQQMQPQAGAEIQAAPSTAEMGPSTDVKTG